MRKVLISSFDMEVGGVERSLVSMLNNFDYTNNEVDLMLYSHTGDFMPMLNNKVNLLSEIKQYSTFRKSIGETIKQGNLILGLTRILSKFLAKINGRLKDLNEYGIYQMQLMWKYSLPFLPKLEKEYDVAISYLWPHYFVAEKVQAKRKIAWIHTDYSTIETDIDMDLEMWNKFDYIISISDDCTKAFLEKYPKLKNKIILVENITSPQFVLQRADENIEEIVFRYKGFKIVSTGRLCYQKAFDNAVKALRILHDRGLTDIKWYVIGYGGDEEIIKKLIKENKLEDSFILLGKKINPYPYMKNCDIYVQPSRYEGKAVTVTESRILCKPTLITNYPTANSQLNNGFDGYICDLSIKGIADGIEKLYRDKSLRENLSLNCKSTDYSNSYELNKLYNLFN